MTVYGACDRNVYRILGSGCRIHGLMGYGTLNPKPPVLERVLQIVLRDYTEICRRVGNHWLLIDSLGRLNSPSKKSRPVPLTWLQYNKFNNDARNPNSYTADLSLQKPLRNKMILLFLIFSLLLPAAASSGWASLKAHVRLGLPSFRCAKNVGASSAPDKMQSQYDHHHPHHHHHHHRCGAHGCSTHMFQGTDEPLFRLWKGRAPKIMQS